MASIDKLQAAERLIVAGIAMLERGEDPLAVHVVAASAFSMLRELLKVDDGSLYMQRLWQEGLFLGALERLEGKPSSLPESPQMTGWLNGLAAAIDAGKVTEAKQIAIDLKSDEMAKMLKVASGPFNFLKHAKADPLATLDEKDVDPDTVLQHALTAFGWLSPDTRWPESILPFAQRHGIV